MTPVPARHATRRVAARVVALLALAGAAAGVRAASGGPDGAGYTWLDSNSGCLVEDDPFVLPDSGTFVPGSGTELFIGPIDLGFTMPFYDRFVSQVWLHASGVIFFEPPPSVPIVPNAAIPTSGDDVAGFVAPYWTAMLQAGGPHCWWESHAAQGWFKIAYSMIPLDSPTGASVVFEVYLDSTGSIRIEYLEVGDGQLATIGIESFDETSGLELRHDLATAPGMTFGRPLPFAICIAPPAQPECAAATIIRCGEAASATTVDSIPIDATSYNCAAGTWFGNEKVFRLTLDTLSDVNLTLSGTGSRSMGAFILSDCFETSCIVGGNTVVDALALMAGTYYVIVDAPTPADDGDFTLITWCQGAATPIVCGETLPGDTTGQPARFQDHACVPPSDWYGAEAIYEVDFAPPGNLIVTVGSVSGQGAFAFAAARPITPTNCLAGGVGGAVLYDPPAGRYLVVVDGPAGSEGPFTITVSCRPEIECDPAAGLLGCNDHVAGTTIGAPQQVDYYRCDGTIHDGPEAVYRFDNPTAQGISFVLDTAEPGLDLFLLDSCNESACTAFGDSVVSARLLPGTYYVVVDGAAGAAADFELSSFCGSGLQPASVSYAGRAGDCFDEHKTAWLTPDLVRADILFAIDLTSSMGEEVAALRANMASIIDNLRLFIPDVQFGLAAYKDYAASPSIPPPCAYSSAYGSGSDYPYRLVQPITPDRGIMQTAVDGLGVGGGGDGPESSARMLDEARLDPAIAWRPGAKRIIVGFGDEMPHDCNVLECLGGTTSSRGVDLGRDGLPGTTDDLAIQDVVQDLVSADMGLIHFDSSGGGTIGAYTYAQVWSCWASRTGGIAEGLNADGTVPANIGGIDCDPTRRQDCLAELVASRIQGQGQFCPDLRLEAQAGYESWLVDAGAVYRAVWLPTLATFDIRFCVPPGAAPGPHDFEVRLFCGAQLVARQFVHVDVLPPCAASLVIPAADAITCEGGTATLDGSGLQLVGCTGGELWEWRDDLGAIVGTSSSLDVAPTVPATYDVTLTCASDPSCTVSDDAHVDVELPPLFQNMGVLDPEPCVLGLLVAWDPATFRDPSGTGVYDVYRSEVDCADALLSTPVAVGLPGYEYVDSATQAGRAYWYVVQAEDARTSTACVAGPNNGGAVNANVVCFGPVSEDPAVLPPDLLGWSLRAWHAGQDVTFEWVGGRALLASEHYHVLKGVDPSMLSMTNGEGQLADTWTENDTSSRLQFFDVRIANACEVESLDDEPSGWDVPHP